MNGRPNRVILTIAAVILIAAGVIALLGAADVVRLATPAELYGQMTAGAQAYPWAWILGMLAGSAILIAVGLWLMGRQLRRPNRGRLDTVVIDRGGGGRTTLKAVAAADAIADDLRRHPSIVDSSVRIVTFGTRPRLEVDLDISTETDTQRALAAADSVYQRLSGVFGVESVSVVTNLRPRRSESSRVV